MPSAMIKARRRTATRALMVVVAAVAASFGEAWEVQGSQLLSFP
jgi:hypothetical protein